ncbi:MAG TPA: chromosome segregation protein SMC [Chitinophagales bacterium]|nr:chromosome segregation protein SMC [Chitinophagales bacterium]
MKLTSLNIKGFKSFPEKTSIHFNESITGVVGPNGSGKSNIVDAIRWVLGEQKTSSLRSEKMDNLIFNGSKERKPSGMAEVSLSFENNKGLIPSEFKDITITRILHRNGESEYRINNVPCRLKDITGLFMDTGVASDSYAIIELKMIDEILNDRENSRRRLFEQASGISKYKIRKRETLNKLTLTDTDLARVEDLLFEIGNNLKELESQARKTKRYHALKDEYKALSLQLARMQVARQRDTFQQIEAQKQEQDDKRLEIETRITQVEAEIAKEKTALIEKEKNLTSRQKELNELINAITKKESEKNLANEQVRFLNERIAQLQKQTGESEAGIVKLTMQLEQINEKRILQKSSLEAFVKELEFKQQEMTGVKQQNDQLKTELDTLRESNQALERQVHDLEKKIAINTAEKENLTAVISQNTGKNKELEEQIARLHTESESVKAEIDAKKNKLETLLKEEEKLQAEIEKAENDLRGLEQTHSKESRKLDSKRNEYSLNKSLVDSLEGFPESIKFLKKKSETAREAQMLSDIFYCGEQYRAAIENFLEPFLNYFVVDDIKEAYESINLLSDASIGRANFFILKKFENYQRKPKQAISNAIPALDVVEIDDKYKQLAAFLLDNVYLVAEDKFSESEMSAENAILLSVNGKYIRTGYSLSGGALGLFEGMRLGRIKNLEKLKDEIRELENRVKEYESQMDDLHKKIASLKSSSSQQAIEAVREDLSRTGPNLVSLLTRIENFQSFIAENLMRNSGITGKIRQLETENEKLRIQWNDLLSRKEKSGMDYEQLLSRFNAVSESLAKTTGEFNEKNIEFHRQQNLLHSLEQESGFAERQIGELRARIRQAQQEIKLDEEKMAQQHEKLGTLESELIASYTEKENFQKTLTEAEAQYYDARGAINELEEQLKTHQKNRAHIDLLLNEIKDKSTEMRIELNAIRERLSVEFNVNLDSLMEGQPEEGLIEEEVREKALKVKSRLDNFGEINPMAVEAFEEMQKRYEFITTQKNDLLEAKKSLMETISEIEDTAKEKFMEAFEKARENFQNIFRTLFSEEDTCDLILLTPDNPLESEIEIIAKPKGKKPQTINQLSGGEKSLTALAILFALYLLKPAPFCVLDEVDAPLDDANIDKFNKTIRHFSKDSQFILVTHNKQTMASVDVIYGVTMPENGVSRVVPVDFRSLN